MKAIFCILLFPLFSFCQNESPTLKSDTLFLANGFKVYKGLKIKIGTGSMPDGDFKFIRISNTSLFSYSTYNGHQGYANQENSLPRASAGFTFEVLRIDARGSKKTGFVYYPILKTGLIRYEVDILNAISSGEIVIPDEFNPNKQVNASNDKKELSIADELVKLKKLYSDSTLTKEEYEAAKKKLLEKE